MKACSMLQRRLDDGVLAIGALVRGQHQIDGGVADRVGRDPPASPVHLADDRHVAFRVDRLQSTERSFLTPRLFVRRAHQSAFEAAIDAELDAAGAQPLVALVRLNPRLIERSPDGRGIAAWSQAAR